MGYVEEPVTYDVVDVDLAALRTTAAELVFNGCSGGTGSADVCDLLVCERPVDGFSLSPPGRALQAGTAWELMVDQGVLLQSTFSVLLPTGPTARFRMPVWWKTQTNRKGDGGPLGPHVAARGGIQIN